MIETQLIVGLGNPGKKYAETRHNAGSMVIDQVRNSLESTESFGASLGAVQKNKLYELWIWQALPNRKVLLVKPLTYMNECGEAVGEVVRFFKIADDDILIVHDDLDMPLGQIRLRGQASSGGHNGLKSIEQHLGHNHFRRLKLGIGRPTAPLEAEDYVLQKFSKEEEPLFKRVIAQSANIVVLLGLHKKEFVEETIQVAI